MSVWQQGVYNAHYVLNQPGLISQIKFECNAQPGRLEELSVEKYDNGDTCLVFTTHQDATNDSKQGSMHARLAYNSLFQDLKTQFNHPQLKYHTTNDEVHYVSVSKGHERLLKLVLTRLEEYDNTLCDIRKSVLNALEPKKATVEEIEKAITSHKERLKLLGEVMDQEEKVQRVSRSRRATHTKKMVTKRRGKKLHGRRKRG